MKIIAGRFKGRIIKMPEGIRPTSNKVREALFEILKNKIQGSVFLDLYCGSGAIGIEAFSRGAKAVTFVDNDFRCINVLKDNLSKLGILDMCNIYRRDVVKGIEDLRSRIGQRFDIIFMDPPYYKDMARNTLIAFSDYDILAPNVLAVIELSKRDFLPDEIAMFKKARVSQYGDTKLEFYCLKC